MSMDAQRVLAKANASQISIIKKNLEKAAPGLGNAPTEVKWAAQLLYSWLSFAQEEDE